MSDQNNNTPAAEGGQTSSDLVIDDSTRNEAGAPETEVAVTEAPILTQRPPSETVQQDAEVTEPLPKDWKDPTIVALPADTFERTQEAIRSLPNVRIDDTAEGQEWAAALRNSQYTMQFKGFFTPTTEREGSKFKQAVQSERGMLSAAAPSFKDNGGEKLTGERAMLRVRALMGMGSIVQIPLWHSGFWLTLKAPSDADILELYRRISEEKINLGRQTYGLAFANNSVFFAASVMDFAFAHFYDCSLKDNSIGNARAKVSSLDIPIIAWGLACTVWPRGFQYARAVLDGEINKTIKEKLNLGKLQWTDTTALTPWQIAHMAQRSGNQMTNEALDRYRSEFTRGQGRLVELSEQVKVTLRVPTLDQYLTSGQKWVNNIVAMVDRAFSLPQDEDARDRHIRDHGRATNMRQYAHWVESIQAGNNLIEDEETIEQVLDVLSADDAVREAYFEGVRKYMEDATISLIAVPAVTEQENSKLPRFPHLLPLDVLSTFFILLVQKIEQIQTRT